MTNTNPSAPGKGTSEFLATMVALIVPALLAALTAIIQSGFFPESSPYYVIMVAVIAALSTVPVAAYNISRGMVKQAEIKKESEVRKTEILVQNGHGHKTHQEGGGF